MSKIEELIGKIMLSGYWNEYDYNKKLSNS